MEIGDRDGLQKADEALHRAEVGVARGWLAIRGLEPLLSAIARGALVRSRTCAMRTSHWHFGGNGTTNL